MYYYEVLVAQEYAARESVFTYASEQQLQPLQFVVVPLQKKQAAGIVVKNVQKPTFATKPVVQVFDFSLQAPQRQIVRFLKTYYQATEAQALQLFMPPYLAAITSQQASTQATQPATLALPPLTPEQTGALAVLRSQPTETVLLHGDTGTGKTRVFIERTNDVIAQGRTVVVLAPEIGLVPQLANQFKKLFGEQVASYHSGLKNSERAAAWSAVASGNARIIIGTRSTLFLPLTNVGLIILDESHEPAYKQEEGIRYHATRVASTLAAHQKAQLLLASATPLVSDIYLAKQRGKSIIRMKQAAVASSTTTTVQLVDMKEKAEFSTHPMLSNTLLRAIESALASGEQSLIYLNRRGTARTILCQSCGWQAMCPTCDTSLTYHHDYHKLKCHTCNYTTKVPQACPECGSSEVLFKSAGTKALATWLQKHFSQADVGRFDTDNLKAESLQERHDEVSKGSIDILVGTQMLVKGLDLTSLAVVGIVAADLSLQIPDFSAEERTFQLLQQAMGRVGRGHRNGTTIVQTYNPTNDIISHAIAKNYDEFYTTQIAQRTDYAYSPIVFMATFWLSLKTASKATEQATKIKNHMSKIAPNCIFLGPSVTYRPKRKGYNSVQIVVKTTNRNDLYELVKILPNGWQYDLEPIQLL